MQWFVNVLFQMSKVIKSNFHEALQILLANHTKLQACDDRNIVDRGNVSEVS